MLLSISSRMVGTILKIVIVQFIPQFVAEFRLSGVKFIQSSAAQEGRYLSHAFKVKLTVRNPKNRGIP